MHRFKRLITAIFLTVISLILLVSAGLAYLVVTPLGGKLLVRYFKQEFAAQGLMHIGHYQGSLHEGFILKDVRITGLSYMPNALLKIQEVRVRIPLLDWVHSDFDIFNARIFIPDSDPVVFTGEVFGGQVKGDLYARSVDIHEASRFWATDDISKNLQGFISDADIIIHGPLSSPRLTGSFLADSIRFKSTSVSDGLSRVDLVLSPSLHQFQIRGEVIINSGLVKVRDVNLQLNTSKFIFRGDVFKPSMDIHLSARLEDMDFHLTVSGTFVNPQLLVSSDPPMAPEDALQVLFTGNAWSASTSPFNGPTASELAEEFLGYSSQGTNGEQQQLGFKTKLTDNLKLGAEMDQIPLPTGETNTYYSRKINGEMDMTDHMSLNVSREIFPQDSYPSYQGDQPEADTQVYLQYKKRF